MVGIVVQLHHVLAGYPGPHGAALGWTVLTTSLSLITLFTVILIVSADAALAPSRTFALGVTPATADGLLDTVGPWLGEPDHLNVPIAALLMPPKT